MKVGGLIKRLRAAGHSITSFDIGGGLGIPYGNNTTPPPLPSEYAAMVKRLTADLNVEMIFEPGRMIAGNSGILLSEVLYVCLLYTSPSPRDLSTSRMPSSA